MPDGLEVQLPEDYEIFRAQVEALPDYEAGLAVRAMRYAFGVQRNLLLSNCRDVARVDSLVAVASDPHDQDTMAALIDNPLQERTEEGMVESFIRVLNDRGIPSSFGAADRLMLFAAKHLGQFLPAEFVSYLIKEKILSETSGMVVPGEEYRFKKAVKKLLKKGADLNINHLGETILSEWQAEERLKDDVVLLENPLVNCISVKISNLYSQINPADHVKCVDRVIERLVPRLQAALKNKREDGQPKMVYLDMEAYSDLPITVDVFTKVAEDERFKDLKLGIALQAYIPDSHTVLEDLLEVAHERKDKGWAPLRFRIVKGANMAMESINASDRGWEDPVYQEKADTDANWKNMVELALRNHEVCETGIATHNYIDSEWALALAEDLEVPEGRYQNEVLLGMVNDYAGMLDQVLMYAPTATKTALQDAFGYLVRRFAEVGAHGNFMKGIGRSPNSEYWMDVLMPAFLESVRRRATVSTAPRRKQDRLQDGYEPVKWDSLSEFGNEPDTDFTVKANRIWLARLMEGLSGTYYEHPVRIGKTELRNAARRQEVHSKIDPSLVVGKVDNHNAQQMGYVINTARNLQEAKKWSETSIEYRKDLLFKVAAELQVARGELMQIACHEVGKTWLQSDPEVSEAIGFCRYYGLAAKEHASDPNVQVGPTKDGVVLVISPWNFPISIAAGGVAAALSQGNRVILKPSPKSRLTTLRMAQAFWDAGVPKEVLQVVNCDDSQAHVLTDAIDDIIFTGSTATANKILESRPGINLMAETGGKNATIITNSADIDGAIKNIIASYGFAGQKCSATSRVIITPAIAKDPTFRNKLVSAVRSLNVGLPNEPGSVVTPMIDEVPNESTLRGLIGLEAGEEWWLKPRSFRGRRDHWTPGIRFGAKPDSFAAQTEFFAPVIDVMVVGEDIPDIDYDQLNQLESSDASRILEDHHMMIRRIVGRVDLAKMIEVVNSTPYGLTFGLESLSPDEIAMVRELAEAGVIYINSPTVGAVEGRWGFGGHKASRRGPGIQAGFENYPTRLGTYTPTDAYYTQVNAKLIELKDQFDARTAEVFGRIMNGKSRKLHDQYPVAADKIKSYLMANHEYFSKPHTPHINVKGKQFEVCNKPLGRVVIRPEIGADPNEVIAAVVGAYLAGNEVELYLQRSDYDTDDEMMSVISFVCNGEVEGFYIEEEELVEKLDESSAKPAFIHFVGYSEPHPLSTRADLQVNQSPLSGVGRIDLHNWTQEQSLVHTYHRHGGNLREKDY